MQQINLYQLKRAAQRQLLAATTVCAAFGVIALLLLLTWGYGIHAVNRLAREVDAARSQQLRQTSLLAGADSSSATTAVGIDVLQTQLKTLGGVLAERKRALQMLHLGAAGGTVGFSAQLIALAHQHLEGVWLEHIVLDGATGVQSLQGGTLDPQLVPRYLHGLAAETALAGTRFDEFRIESKVALDAPLKVNGVAKEAAAMMSTPIGTPASAPGVIHFHVANTSGKTGGMNTGLGVNLRTPLAAGRS